MCLKGVLSVNTAVAVARNSLLQQDVFVTVMDLRASVGW